MSGVSPPVKILLVDDEPKNLTALAAVLESPDRELVLADSGQAALKNLLDDSFAVILLDVHMPDLDGFETAELIRGREQSRDTPIIFLTAAISEAQFVSRGYSLGAVDYIVKPFDPNMLRSKVAVFVELFRKTEQIKRQADELSAALERARRERARLVREQVARAEAETARDRLQQEVELERHKDAFLAAASHDLKNPITAIKARAQILERRAAKLGTEEAAVLVEGLRGIDQSAKRLTGMINELLDVTRLQMGRPLDLDRRPMDLTGLAHEVASDLEPASERHQIRVECEPEPVVGQWDRARLERVLSNLVSNAIKYSPDGGQVTVAVRREQDNGRQWAVLQVLDEGLGIPSDEVPRVFERFYRGSNVAGKIEGTGIGLSGVRQIVEQHGGDVSVNSREAVGSTFTVRLPVEQEQPEW